MFSVCSCFFYGIDNAYEESKSVVEFHLNMKQVREVFNNMKIHISLQMQSSVSFLHVPFLVFFSHFFAHWNEKTQPSWRRREERERENAKKISWKMYPHPNDDIIAILYSLQFFISSVRSLLWLLSFRFAIALYERSLAMHSHCLLPVNFHFEQFVCWVRLYYSLFSSLSLFSSFLLLFCCVCFFREYFSCFVFQLQNVIAHIFHFLYGRYCIFLLSQGEYNTTDGIQYASQTSSKKKTYHNMKLLYMHIFI